MGKKALRAIGICVLMMIVLCSTACQSKKDKNSSAEVTTVTTDSNTSEVSDNKSMYPEEEINEIISLIEKESSKSSNTYYYDDCKNYISGMEESTKKIRSFLKKYGNKDVKVYDLNKTYSLYVDWNYRSFKVTNKQDTTIEFGGEGILDVSTDKVIETVSNIDGTWVWDKKNKSLIRYQFGSEVEKIETNYEGIPIFKEYDKYCVVYDVSSETIFILQEGQKNESITLKDRQDFVINGDDMYYLAKNYELYQIHLTSENKTPVKIDTNVSLITAEYYQKDKKRFYFENIQESEDIPADEISVKDVESNIISTDKIVSISDLEKIINNSKIEESDEKIFLQKNYASGSKDLIEALREYLIATGMFEFDNYCLEIGSKYEILIDSEKEVILKEKDDSNDQDKDNSIVLCKYGGLDFFLDNSELVGKIHLSKKGTWVFEDDSITFYQFGKIKKKVTFTESVEVIGALDNVLLDNYWISDMFNVADSDRYVLVKSKGSMYGIYDFYEDKFIFQVDSIGMYSFDKREFEDHTESYFIYIDWNYDVIAINIDDPTIRYKVGENANKLLSGFSFYWSASTGECVNFDWSCKLE